jgi:phospholipase/lecithinase/hemolysin
MLKGLGIALGAAGLLVAAPAAADRDTARYTSLTVFGDSLVDAGNIRVLAPSVVDPTNGYFMGRFTNGYDYTDYINLALFGTPTRASLTGGTNFAYGGARASATSGVPDFSEQLAQYAGYLARGNAVDRNGLYVVNFGGNDIFNAPADPALEDAFIRNSARDYVDGVQALLDLGVRNVLLTGFPVLTDPLSFTAEGYLTTELARLRLDADDTLFRFSYLDFFNRVSSNPGSLGLPTQRTDITCQAAGRAAIDAGCVGIFSLDGTHPTAAVQAALFQDVDRQFNLTGAVPEPATWMTLILGFGAIGAAMRRRRRTITPAVRAA